ncbi:MAG: L-threonylcarbamoyladenylate synthase [Gammaproteobacteria bacterium]
MDSAIIAAAVSKLRAGEVVAFPTETVYGLGADAARADAVAKIFERKGRPPDHPLIVHIADQQALTVWAGAVSPHAHTLAERFWPGPLTLILPRAPGVLDSVTGGQATIGVRCPAHPIATALLQACALHGIQGLAAPSANRFGRISPTTATHVHEEFGPDLMIVDGGPCRIGIESTIVDVSAVDPRILRPGIIGLEAIAEALHTQVFATNAEAPRVPGTLAVHYAPNTTLLLAAPSEVAEIAAALRAHGLRVIALLREGQAPPGIASIAMPLNVCAYAERLYASLRLADTARVDRIVVETPPETAEWLAIRDRLQRAAGLSR